MTRSPASSARARPDARPASGSRALSPALACVAGPLQELLERFLEERIAELDAIDPALQRIGREVREFVVAGGKRLRPAFVYWGHRATGADHDEGVIHLGAAVELLHSFALIHDDVMDRSVLRRGRPTVHTALTAAHDEEGLLGDAGWFGVAAAILAGDLAFVWTDALLDGAPLPAERLDRARQVFHDLRVELVAGQYLDVRLAGRRDAAEGDALRVALLKAGRYTVTRPLLLGAAVGESGEDLEGALRTYGDAVGLAFQLRDDVLGLFGDPSRTGKGRVEDLREGKRTLLMLRALSLADERQHAQLSALLGDPDAGEADAERARRVIRETGALAAVEALLADQRRVARQALDVIPSPAREALDELASVALDRDS